MQRDRYTRLVSWLKVLFPLMALGLLSTLFLLSRAIDPGHVLTTPDGKVGTNRAQNLRATISTPEGTTFRLQSDMADFDLAQDYAELLGGVVFTTSTGYRLTSEKMMSELSSLNLKSPGPVFGTAPAGTLEAGAMSVTQAENDQAPQLLFTNRVKLIYKPKPLIE